MNPIRRRFAGCTLLGSLLLVVGCPPPSPTGPDTTPPEFVSVTVELKDPSASRPSGGADITSKDAKATGLDPRLELNVQATAGDPQSAIKSIEVKGTLNWRCRLGPHNEIIGNVTSEDLVFVPSIS